MDQGYTFLHKKQKGKTMKYILICFIMMQSAVAFEWRTMLAEYRTLMGSRMYRLLLAQYDAFIQGDAPTIADVRIKEIPIIECNGPLVDVRVRAHPRIKVMEKAELPKAHMYPEDIDSRSDKHGQVRLGVFEALKRMIEELDKLAPAFGYQVGELEIRLFEGLRDVATQKQLFDGVMARIRKENPEMTEEQAYQETCKWVSPYINNVPVHSTGAAIDIHLWSNKRNAFCDMGRFNVAGPFAPTFSTEPQLSENQKRNRLLLLMAATRAGLTNYVYEFWHFSYGDRYASYWRQANPQARRAIYGSV